MPRTLLIQDEALVNGLRQVGYHIESVQAEEPRYIIDVPDDWNGLVELPGGTVAILAGEQLVRREQVLIIDPTERMRVKDEIAQMVQVWLSLGDLPGGDDYDASDLVEKIVLGYESLGEYNAANIYRAMIAREKAHDWGDEDDVLIFSADEQGALHVDQVPFSEAFGVPVSPPESDASKGSTKGSTDVENDIVPPSSSAPAEDDAISDEGNRWPNDHPF